MKNFKGLFISVLMLVGLLFSGCGSEITAYRYSDCFVESSDKILVLPFLDARTFVDKNDPLKDQVAEKARLIFVEELRKNCDFARAMLIVPKIEGQHSNYSMSDAVLLAGKYNCNIVFCGQVFSFTGTRAASIPPRAGLFVRVFDAAKKKQIFAGESYNAAGVPGADGGREHQCRIAAAKILKNLSQKKSLQTVAIKPVEENAQKILFLPYHERKNPLNMIEKNGGGPVVTSIYGMELARKGKIDVMLDAVAEKADYYNKVTKEDALAIARAAGADYVVRGEVVEFRRAQSVPSLWSAAISLSILAAQVMFAEVSGVDIATEVYRVSDGECLYVNRQISHQKYVVSAEKTVRMLAGPVATEIMAAINNKDALSATPIIDDIEVPDSEEEIKEAASKLAAENSKGKAVEASTESVVKTEESDSQKLAANVEEEAVGKEMAEDNAAQSNRAFPPMRRK